MFSTWSVKLSGSVRSSSATNAICWRYSNEPALADLRACRRAGTSGVGYRLWRGSHLSGAASTGSRSGLRHGVRERDVVASDVRDSIRRNALFRGGSGHGPLRVCWYGCASEVSAARRGEGMNSIEHMPPWAAALTAFLLLVGAAATLVGSLGLLRFGTF